jgi:hypothetical protein
MRFNQRNAAPALMPSRTLMNHRAVRQSFLQHKDAPAFSSAPDD